MISTSQRCEQIVYAKFMLRPITYEHLPQFLLTPLCCITDHNSSTFGHKSMYVVYAFGLPIGTLVPC